MKIAQNIRVTYGKYKVQKEIYTHVEDARGIYRCEGKKRQGQFFKNVHWFHWEVVRIIIHGAKSSLEDLS
jgi:hypothetical protein